MQCLRILTSLCMSLCIVAGTAQAAGADLSVDAASESINPQDFAPLHAGADTGTVIVHGPGGNGGGGGGGGNGGGGNGGGGGGVPLDGGTIYYVANSTVNAINPDGSGATSLNVEGSSGYYPSEALHGGERWFVRIKVVAGTNYPDGQPPRELFAESEGGDLVQLTSTAGTDMQIMGNGSFPAWSVDPNTLDVDGMVSWTARSWDGSTVDPDSSGIFRAEVDYDAGGAILGLVAGTTTRALELELYDNCCIETGPRPDAQNFAWSPDGSQLVYSRWSDEALYVADAGQPPAQHSSLGATGRGADWSPDLDTGSSGLQTKIAYGYDNDIFTIDPDGANDQRILNGNYNRGFTFQWPTWSPAGTHLTVTRREWDNGWVTDTGTYHLLADGSDLTRVTQGVNAGWAGN